MGRFTDDLYMVVWVIWNLHGTSKTLDLEAYDGGRISEQDVETSSCWLPD